MLIQQSKSAGKWKLKGGDKLDWEWNVIEGQMALVVGKVLLKFFQILNRLLV